MSKTYRSADEVLKRAKEIYKYNHHPFKTLDINQRLKSGGNKGNLGQIVEEGWFDIAVNSRHEKDFPEADLELKLIPYLRSQKSDLRGKERLVVSMINYKEEAKITKFEDSTFWKKANQLLIMTYEHKYEVDKGEYYVDYARIFKIPENDLVIIKNDWKIINNYIRNGKAHELSESLTNYLGACTKGASSEKLVDQFNSDIKAKPRAFCLKSSYVNSLLKSSLFFDDSLSIVENVKIDFIENEIYNVENLLESKVNSASIAYTGFTVDDIKMKLNISKESKNINSLIVNKMLKNFDSSIIEELEKSNTLIKTVTIDEGSKFTLKESMSFPTFRFIEIINEDWSVSKQREYFEDLRILFFVFIRKENTIRFHKHFFYTLNEKEIAEISKVYNSLRKILKEGNVFQYNESRKIYTNRLPKSTENSVAHIRPHASKSDYTKEGKNADWIPIDNTWMTKQCFWLNSKYIKEIVLKNI